MNDIRRTVLWVIFGFSCVLLWDNYQVSMGNKAMFSLQPKAAAPAAVANKATAPAANKASAAADVPTARSSSTSSDNALPATVANTPVNKAALITVTTDVYKLGFDPVGGTLVRAELVQLPDAIDHSKRVVLLDESAERFYVAQTGLVGAPDLPNHKTPMTLVSTDTALKEGQNALDIQFESAPSGGVKWRKTYTLKRGAYDIALSQEVTNVGASSITPQVYLQLVRDGNKPAGESSFYSTFTGPVVYTEAKKYHKIEFKDIEKNNAEIDKQSNSGYVGMVQHYFASAWLLPEGTERENFVRKVDTNMYAVGMITTLKALAAGETQKIVSTLFVGPEEEKKLAALAPGLDLVKDYGWLAILSKPLYWLLDKLNSFIHNWGWSIVALVVLLKIAFFWLNAKAYQSMAKMKAISPKITEMRARLKDKPQQMQQEMMRIYREEKVNPMGGCLPIVIQIPVFIALYWVLLSTVEMRNAPWIGWIHDLSAPDPFFILPVVMTGTTLLQTWLNPTPPDPMQAKMMWIMPLMFSFMFFMFPAGLVLYWLTNNVLSIAQQWLINKKLGVN